MRLVKAQIRANQNKDMSSRWVSMFQRRCGEGFAKSPISAASIVRFMKMMCCCLMNPII